MTTYELRTSDGTHTTLAGVITSIKALWPSSMDDITVNVEGGATFGTVTVDNNFGAATTGWNGKTVIFQTKESERATPATLLGSWSLTGGSFTGAYGHVEFYCIRLGYQLTANQGMFLENANHARVSLRNCVVAIKTSSTYGFFDVTVNDSVVNNNTFLISGLSVDVSTIYPICGSGARQSKNNIVCVNSTITMVTVTAAVYGTYVSLYNYGTGGIMGTSPDVSITMDQDPKFEEAPLVTGTDTVASMLSKNIRLQSDSPCVGTAEAATAESIDILGNSRA